MARRDVGVRANSHKNARTDPFVRRFTNSPWTGVGAAGDDNERAPAGTLGLPHRRPPLALPTLRTKDSTHPVKATG